MCSLLILVAMLTVAPPDSSTAQGMDEGDIFSVVLGEIHGSMLEWASSSTSRWTVKPNATMTVGSQTVSFTDQTPNLYGWARYIRRIVDYGVRQSVDFRVQGSMLGNTWRRTRHFRISS